MPRLRSPAGFALAALLVTLAPAPAALAAPTAAALARARVLNEEGLRHYKLGAYDKALAAFKEAYLTDGDPNYLFNIGQCQRVLGDHEQAIRSYKLYLHDVPDAANRAEVERLLAMIDAELAHKSAANAAPPLQPIEGGAVKAATGSAASKPVEAAPAPAAPVAASPDTTARSRPRAADVSIPSTATVDAPPPESSKHGSSRGAIVAGVVIGAVVVVGAAVAIGVGVSASQPSAPSGTQSVVTF